MNEWIKISNKKPKKGQHILGLWHWGNSNAHYESNVVSWIYNGKHDGNITHWMALPEPPIKDTQ